MSLTMQCIISNVEPVVEWVAVARQEAVVVLVPAVLGTRTARTLLVLAVVNHLPLATVSLQALHVATLKYREMSTASGTTGASILWEIREQVAMPVVAVRVEYPYS